MNGILNDDEYIEVEGRAYANPDLPVQETNRFIENLRSVQQGDNAEIAAQTEALGTAVPSNLGGLLGGEGYWTSRLQTPQTNTLAQNLRTAAQASALSQALENEQTLWKERYQNAYRNYQSRQYDRARSGSSSGSNTGGDNTSTWDGEIEDIVSDGNGGLSAVSELTLDNNDIAAGGRYVVEPGSGNIIRIDDTLSIDDPGYQRVYYQQPDGSYATQDKKFVMRNGNILQNNASNLFQASPILKGNL